MDPARRLVTLGVCIVLSVCDTTTQNNNGTGTSGNCSNNLSRQPNTKCVNSTHSICRDGYRASGNPIFNDVTATCDDINECVEPDQVNCGPHANCTNMPGSYNCICIRGYESSSGKATFRNASENSCRDIDECLGPSQADCGPHAHCTNTPGSYICSCIDGYESSSGNASFRGASENSCRDIDECREPSQADCGPHAHCTNTPGNYYCSCIVGYESSSGKATFRGASENSCRDIDECQEPSQADCGPHAHCTNTPGNYYCSCIGGYESSSGKATFRGASENSCRDIDECRDPSRADCGPHAHCINTPGNYICSCIDGYESSYGNATFRGASENSCRDIDECRDPSRADCGPHAHCINTPGNYYCNCIDGYESSSGKATFRNASENSCQDIDECLGPSRADCGPNANCTNTPGNYYCNCIDGYESSSGKATFRGASENSCQDIDECREPSRADCGANANCTNTPGNYHCICIDGYESSSGKATFRNASENSCRDINECVGPDQVDCGANANCTNTPGSYICICIDGYESSSGKATFRNASENRCRGTSGNCSNNLSRQPNTKCVNSTHSTCRDGYQASGNPIFDDVTATCDDINECLGPSRADCGANTNCTNTPGSFYCICLDGYESSSGKATFRNASENSCRDIDECQRNATVCEPHGICINTPGNYTCKCKSGFGKSQKNELKISTGTSGNCSNHLSHLPNAKCVNSTHSTCRDGYRASGNPIFNDVTATCDDINECLGPDRVDCGANTICTNMPGSFNCICIDGYEFSSGKAPFRNASENSCRDIDECQRNATVCEPHGICINTPGNYTCKCKSGFGKSQRNQLKICTDINECTKTPNICGLNAECINTQGSYKCECWPGYIPLRNTSQCEELTYPLLPDDNLMKAKVEHLCQESRKLQQMNASDTASKETLQNFLNMLEELLTEVQVQNRSMAQKRHVVTEVMAVVERLLGTLTKALPDGWTGVKATSGTELTLAIKRAGYQSQETVSLQQSKMQMELKWPVAPGQKKEGFTLTGLLTYHGLSSMLEGVLPVEAPEWDKIVGAGPRTQEPGQPSYRVLSPVVSAFTNNLDSQARSPSVSLRFNHPTPESKQELHLLCAYWDTNSTRWSTRGCTKLKSHDTSTTTCQCSHLTSFAVLMAFYELEEWTLDIITKVGLVISLVCLLLAIVTFLFCRTLKSPRTMIHLHLCLSLFVADAVFLIGASSTSNKVACSVVAGLLHYFFLAAFCWMCLEGAELYLLVVKVFTPPALKRRYMCLLGYGVPALIVGISAAAYSEGYGTERYCWLSLKKEFRWSFLAPVCVIVAINAVIFVVTVWKLSQKFAEINPPLSELKKFSMLTATAIAQLCILGITWIFGIFQFSDHSLVMSYVFTCLNSFQGLFIFLLHCLLKKQVRDEYRRWLCCSKIQKAAKYSEFSISTARQGLQPSQESGL